MSDVLSPVPSPVQLRTMLEEMVVGDLLDPAAGPDEEVTQRNLRDRYFVSLLTVGLFCQKLRQLHAEMDQAVAVAYDWIDLDLGHGFHKTKQGQRYTISEPARREVLTRLLKLNHERYAEEVRQGLHDKKKGTRGKKARSTGNETRTLFE
jgi:hypothetical protein